jgi:protein PsiE
LAIGCAALKVDVLNVYVPFFFSLVRAQQDFFGLLKFATLFQEIPLLIKRLIDATEKIFLVIIALFTVAAMVQEVMLLIEHRKVELKDLLLMFIYAEVLGMLGAFYTSHRIPITIPLFIAITALSRLIILQGKGIDSIVLLYESGAILMIAGATWVISQLRDRDQSNGPNKPD